MSRERMTPLSDATPILVVIDDEMIKTTFGGLLADNDGFDQVEIARMRECLEHGDTYHGGGGAAVSFTVMLDS